MTSTAISSNASDQHSSVLDVVDVSAGYGSTTVLRDVSISVRAGSVTALLGPNGAGKTTLLRVISGLIAPSRGSVIIDGNDVKNKRSYKRFTEDLVHVPEGRGVFRGLTVRDNLAMQSRKGHEDAGIERAVSVFPILGARLGQIAGTLSGGQQQMLAMSAAYIRSSKIVLVDEASLGLAPIVVDEIFEFLQNLAELGTSLLIVDQFANRALAMAETAYVLRQGQVTYSGSAAELADGDLAAHYLGSAGGS